MSTVPTPVPSEMKAAIPFKQHATVIRNGRSVGDLPQVHTNIAEALEKIGEFADRIHKAIRALGADVEDLIDRVELLESPVAAGALIFEVELTANDQAISPPSVDDNGLSVASAALGSTLLTFTKQDATGLWIPVVWGPEFFGHGGGVGTDPLQYTVFQWVKRQEANPQWWAVGVPISYA